MKQQQLGKSLTCLHYLLAKARMFHYGVGRGAGVGRGRGVDVGLCIGDGVGVPVEVAVAVGVGVGEGAPLPPQAIISLPVQTAVCPYRASGALVMLVPAQLSVPGLYFPPSKKTSPEVFSPPQTIISLPVQIAV
jgi:hypothetical protein